MLLKFFMTDIFLILYIDSIKFFKNVGDVVSVRLIVNRECKHVGYGFIVFASPYEAQEVRLVLF